MTGNAERSSDVEPEPDEARGGLINEDWAAVIVGLALLGLVLAGVITTGLVP